MVVLYSVYCTVCAALDIVFLCPIWGDIYNECVPEPWLIIFLIFRWFPLLLDELSASFDAFHHNVYNGRHSNRKCVELTKTTDV